MLSQIQAVVLAAAVATAFAAGWKVRDWKADAEIADIRSKAQDAVVFGLMEQASKTRELQEKADAIVVDYEKRTVAAESTARDLAGRLRQHYARACPDPVRVPDSASNPDAAPGEPAAGGGVEAAVGGVLAACERDAARLTALQEWIRASR
jgi:hypothetical protein